MGCHFFPQGIFPIQESNLHHLHWQADSLPLSLQRSRDFSPGTKISLDLWFSEINMHQKHLESLLKHTILGSIPRVSNSASLCWGLKIWIYNKFPSAACCSRNHTLTTTDPWEGGLRGRGHRYTHGWFTLRSDRKQNSVKQLSFN